ncbi:hypothetical protein D3C71_1843250 [compost metagenome]
MSDIKVNEWPQKSTRGAKRANLSSGYSLPDWFVGYGKDESCQFEGTWWDMICFARNVLASENTKLVAPEYHKPEWKNDNYDGEEKPYEYTGE